MPRKISPKYGVDPVQQVPLFTFTKIQATQLLAVLPKINGNSDDIIWKLEICARHYLWLRNQHNGKPSRAQQNAALEKIASLSKHLSTLLPQLDLDTEWELTNAGALPVGALVHIEDQLQTLAHGATQALALGKTISGPRRTPCVDRVLPDLVRAYEEVTGEEFTHNPYKGTEYTGLPQSPAGRFIVTFFSMVDPAVSETFLSSAMAAFTKTRHARTRSPVN